MVVGQTQGGGPTSSTLRYRKNSRTFGKLKEFQPDGSSRPRCQCRCYCCCWCCCCCNHHRPHCQATATVAATAPPPQRWVRDLLPAAASQTIVGKRAGNAAQGDGCLRPPATPPITKNAFVKLLRGLFPGSVCTLCCKDGSGGPGVPIHLSYLLRLLLRNTNLCPFIVF